MTETRPLDRAFLRRVYRTSLLVFGLALLVSLGRMSWKISGGLTLGYGLSLGTFAYWEWLVTRGFAPVPGIRRRIAILASILIKLPALALILYLAVNRAWVDAASLCVGVAIVHGVLVLKILGRAVAPPGPPA